MNDNTSSTTNTENNENENPNVKNRKESTNSNDKAKDGTNDRYFPSSAILYEIANNEYNIERERANSLDNKASFFITVIVAVSAIFVPIIPFKSVIPFYQKASCLKCCIVSSLLTLVAVSFVLLVISFKKLYNAYRLTDYKRVSIEVINNEGIHMAPKDKVYMGLCTHLKTTVESNYKVNNKKCDSITSGIKLCGIGFMILFFSTIAIIIMIGG